MTNELSMIEDLSKWGIEGPILNVCADAFEVFDKSIEVFPDARHINPLMQIILENDQTPEIKKLKRTLMIKFAVKASELPEVYASMNIAINLYAMYKILPFVYKDIIKEIDKLDRIARAAEKLRKLLPKEGDALLGLLDLAVVAEQDLSGGGKIQEYFKTFDTNLVALMETKDALAKTHLGKAFGVGRPKRKGNLGLQLWIMMLCKLWTNILGRNFKFDGPDGVSGRTRFLDFCYDTLVEFDPSVKFSSIENLYNKDPSCSFGL